MKKLVYFSIVMCLLSGCGFVPIREATTLSATDVQELKDESAYGCVAGNVAGVGGVVNGSLKAAFAWIPDTETATEVDKEIVKRLLDWCAPK